MQKGLCIAALAISVIVFIVFLADLLLGFAGESSKMMAPFKASNMTLDIVFVVCSGILGVMSWFTFREQV